MSHNRRVGGVLGAFWLVTFVLVIIPGFVDSTAWISGALLGFLAPVLHWLTSRWLSNTSGNTLLLLFYLSLAIRTLLVLGLFALLLAGTNLDRISFTLSFIISYIFHSVMDILLIEQNKPNGRTNS